MGTETIPDRAAGQRIKLSWINNLRDIFLGHFVPRGIGGSPRANYARLGSATYPYDRIFAQIGELGVGDIFAFHDYDENIPIPQGWMFCTDDVEDPQVINEANYDAQHSPGDWDLYVGTSPLEGLFLPDMAASYTYLVGKTGTLQDGLSEITKVGANERDFSHNHGSPRTTSTPSLAGVIINDLARAYTYTQNHTHTLTVPSDLSATQDVRPSSTVVKYLMRIV